MTRLPKKLSALIRVALADLAKVEKSKKYRVDMCRWHSPQAVFKEHIAFDRCAVCFAGAVMAKTLKCARTKHVSPEHFSPYVEQRLFALDSVRSGEVRCALRQIGVGDAKAASAEELILDQLEGWPGYDADDREQSKAFKRHMRRVADLLEEQAL